MTSRTPDETIEQGQNVEMQAETNLVDLAMDKKPIEFASEFHERMLGRIKEMLDPYREQLAHDLMKNEVDEEVEEIDELSKKTLGSYAKRAHFGFSDKKKDRSKGITLALKKKHGLPTKEEQDFDLDDLTEEQVEYLLGCIEEDEQLDELSKNKLAGFLRSSQKQKAGKKRREGVNSAITGILGKDKFKSIFGKYQKEETEELDELSKKTLKSYMSKAAPEAGKLAMDITLHGKKDKKTENKFKQRVTGVHRAKTEIDKD